MIQMSKLKIRKYFIEQRNELSTEQRILLTSKINKNLELQKEYIVAKNIGSFRAFRNEPQLTQLINKFYYYPKISETGLTFHTANKGFKLNKLGIEEPIEKQLVPLNIIEIFLVPLISFNKNLHRVGYGSGYYDKTLSQLLGVANKPKFWGICYDFQLSETNFETKFDVRLDKVITDKKVYV